MINFTNLVDSVFAAIQQRDLVLPSATNTIITDDDLTADLQHDDNLDDDEDKDISLPSNYSSPIATAAK